MESSDLGWIKIYRSLLNSDIFQNEKMLKIFVWCLLKANHKSNKVRIGKRMIDVKMGQFIFGRAKAAEELGFSQSTVWSYMKELEERKTIKIKPNNKYSLITIENWALYQDKKENTDNKKTTEKQQKDNEKTTEKQQKDNEKTTEKQQKDTNKNVKNVKNIYTSKIDDLWAIYPNKKGKKIAYKKIEVLLGQYNFEELKRCVERYATETKDKDKQYIQHGSTFFNSGYVDYLDSDYENSNNSKTTSSSDSNWMDVNSL